MVFSGESIPGLSFSHFLNNILCSMSKKCLGQRNPFQLFYFTLLWEDEKSWGDQPTSIFLTHSWFPQQTKKSVLHPFLVLRVTKSETHSFSVSHS